METLRQETDQPYRALSPLLGLPYPTFMRWRGRIGRGEEAVRLPGPRPPELDREQEESLALAISRLRHGRVRTAGTGALRRLWRGIVSRREVQRRVVEHRRELHRRKRRALNRVQWAMPRAVWAMDDMGTSRKGKIHHVRDAASRFDLALLPATSLPGKEVARNLEELIELHGPPLVVKRDNGSNLNAEEVNEVLRRYSIIPLNSPPCYPHYNGGIERGQGEVKGELDAFLAGVRIASPEGKERLGWMKDTLAGRPRPCLGGETPDQAFQSGQERMAWYTKDRRRFALEQIEQTSAGIIKREGIRTKRGVAAAWRRAVETWLLQEGIITIEKGESVTPFSSISVS